VKPKSISKGILANVLNPHPYLFWFSVGAPTITIALNEGIEAMLAFIAGFYIFLVGSKIVLAVLVGKSKFLLSSKAYIYTIRFLGILLCILAVILFRDGLIMMKII